MGVVEVTRGDVAARGSPLILTLPLAADLDRPLRVLAIGAHCDDIEIGVGATLLEWGASGMPMSVDWFVLTSTPEREAETRASARAFLHDAVSSTVTVHSFRDGFLPYAGPGVKEAFETLKPMVEPDVIFTHSRDDLHQDHRAVSSLTWNTFRSHLILEYEIPKYDGDLGHPNAFVEISAEQVRRKCEYLQQFYPSQAGRQWFSASTFEGLMRLRGIEADAGSGYAEAFVARKVALQLGPRASSSPGEGRREVLAAAGGQTG